MLAGSSPTARMAADRVAALDALDVAVLVRHPHAGAGLDHDPLAAGIDEQEVQAAQEAAAVVGVGEAAPERLGDDPEEAAGVGPEPAGAQDADGHATGEGAWLLEQERRGVAHRRATRLRSKSAW